MNPLGNPFDPFGSGSDALTEALRNRTTKPAGKPLPAIRGKRIDDVLYVRAEDVADALESQAPEANKRLIAKLRAAGA